MIRKALILGIVVAFLSLAFLPGCCYKCQTYNENSPAPKAPGLPRSWFKDGEPDTGEKADARRSSWIRCFWATGKPCKDGPASTGR